MARRTSKELCVAPVLVFNTSDEEELRIVTQAAEDWVDWSPRPRSGNAHGCPLAPRECIQLGGGQEMKGGYGRAPSELQT